MSAPSIPKKLPDFSSDIFDLSYARDLVTDTLGLTETSADITASREAQEALDAQKAELEAERIAREEEIQKEIEKRNANRERVLSRGRGYGGTILTSGLDSSTLNVKKKKLGVGG